MCFVVLGCAHITPNYTFTIEGCADRIAENLSRELKESFPGMSILISTPVDAVNYAPSDFGLALQEFIIGSMARKGASVVDVQLRQEPYISCEEGLISLSRDAGRLKGEFSAELIIVTTYLEGSSSVAVTSRAVDFTTNDVVASTTVKLRRSDVVAELLRQKQQVKMYEK